MKKYIKQFRSVICFVLVSLSAVYSFYTPSFAYTETDFFLQGWITTDADSSMQQTQGIPMTSDLVYWVWYNQNSSAIADTYCKTDTGLGGSSSGRFGWYWIDSNTICSFDITVVFYSPDHSYMPDFVYIGDNVIGNEPQFCYYIKFSDDTQSPYVASTYTTIYPSEPVDGTDYRQQRIVSSFNIARFYPNKLLRGIRFNWRIPNNLYDIEGAIMVVFNSFSLGDYTVRSGNLDEYKNAEGAADSMINDLGKVQGIGQAPSVNVSNVLSNSGDFMRWANHFYNLPVLSTMVGLSLTFGILFFLLKKR